LAQGPQRGDRRPNLRGPNRPVTSPYLNLIGNQGFAFQYFRRTVPEVEFRNTDTVLEGSVTQLRNELQLDQQALSSALRETGHKTSFMQYSRYYTFPSR
jgi:hypothetical protein